MRLKCKCGCHQPGSNAIHMMPCCKDGYITIRLYYPFEFLALPLSDRALTKLGFTEYWSGPGDFGTRHLDLKSGKILTITVYDEMDYTEAAGCGYDEMQYCPRRYAPLYERPGDPPDEVDFLHELYEYIRETRTAAELEEFERRCQAAYMEPYIRSWKEFRDRHEPKKQVGTYETPKK